MLCCPLHSGTDMKTHLSQRIAFTVAVLCYAGAAACGFAAFLYQSDIPNDPIRASFMAAVVFFLGCGIVLHVIGKARLGGVLSGSGEIGDDRQGS